MARVRKRLKKVDDVRKLLGDSINRFLGEELTVEELRCLAYSCNVLSGIISAGDLEKRVEQLELSLKGETNEG